MIHRVIHNIKNYIIRMNNKVIVAIDIDEVLALFIPCLARFHNERYNTSLTSSSFNSYEFHKVWGGTAAECSRKMDEFFESKYFDEDIEPVPHAFSALQMLKSETSPSIELHIVTARQFKVQVQTRAWIARHFPDIFQDIHFGNHYTNDGKSRSKSEMCQAIGARLLVDDNQVRLILYFF